MLFKKTIFLTCLALGSVAATSHAAAWSTFIPAECIPVDGKEPVWADPETQQQPWYQAWLKTTTTLCVNLKNALSDNQNHQAYTVDQIVWRTDGRWLFRSVDGKYDPAEKVFEHGLLPWMPNGGNLKIRPGLSSTNSGLTSTAYAPVLTMGIDDYLYILDVTGGGIAVEESIGGVLGTAEDEVAFPGGVKAAHIKGMLVKENGGMAYIANPGYVNYQIVPAGSVELLGASSGVAGEHIVIDVNGQSDDSGIHRFSDKAVKTITAIDRRNGKPRNVTWWVNGLKRTDPHFAPCLELPASLQIDRQILLVAHTGGNAANAVEIPSTDLECARFNELPMRDGKMLQEKVMNAVAHPKSAGETFGGWQATKPVRLMANFVLGIGQDAQAVDLHGQVDWLGAPGIPGGFEQDIYILRDQELRISFLAGKNFFPRCASDSHQSPFFKGDQTFKVQLINELNRVVLEKAVNLGVATELRSTGYMNPEWQKESIRYYNNERYEDFKLRFISTSEEGKACGAMITNVEAWHED
ncbi:scabin-related ADP-ribosyltransferase [Glaciimonas sp. GG7]